MSQILRSDADRNRGAVADLIRWGPTIAGVLIAAAIFTTANAAWLALAFASPDNAWRDVVQWLVGGTAAVSLFLAGLFAGLFSGIRGVAAGVVNGATAWGLFFLLSIAAVLPGAFNVNAELRDAFAAIGDAGTSDISMGLWTVFWTLLIGAALALLGGALGGLIRRRIRVADVDTGTRRTSDARPDGLDRDDQRPEGRAALSRTDRGDRTDTLVDRR